MFKTSDNANPNYLATIVQIDTFHPHPGADRLKLAHVFGNSIVTGIDSPPGLYCFFPLESAISADFLKWGNSFADATANDDPAQKGFFNAKCRVRATRLRGENSEGYIVPASTLEAYVKNRQKKTIVIDDQYVGVDFDTFMGELFVTKYIVRTKQVSAPKAKTKGSMAKYLNRVVDGQFHFHADTTQLRRNMERVHPNDYIDVTEKYHGTSVVISHVLVKRALTFRDKVARFLRVFTGDPTEYGLMYSSRTVIKNRNISLTGQSTGFYDHDIYRDVADKVFPNLKKGYTMYGEIVGFTPSGAYIQKGYGYGCTIGKLDFYIYRMTFTNVDGDVFELSPAQLTDYCQRYDIKTPHLHYRGMAKDMYPHIPVDDQWHTAFLAELMGNHLEKDCFICRANTPAEGIVLRVDRPNIWEAYKLKSFRFILGETAQLDAGAVDMESDES